MKKAVTAIMMLASLCAAGKEVGEDFARRMAESFSGVLTRSSSKITLVHKEIPTSAPKVYNSPSFYVYNIDGGGFVIIAGDDVARPVLAYSEAGNVDPARMSSCQKDWFEWMGNFIYHFIEKGLSPTPATRSEWARYSEEGFTPQRGTDVVLSTASWHQHEPFNRLCPEINGTKCPAGCVNTATAILMKYYSHPEKGEGELEGYELSSGGKIQGRTLGNKYDWAAMPMEYGSYTEYQANQVATLMMDLGVMNYTQYDPSGSGAATSWSVRGLIEHFDYDKSAETFSHEYYDNETFNNRIRKEIDKKRPVLFEGFRPSVGHAFIISGYSGDYFCFNMGWGSGPTTFALISPIEGYEDEAIDYTNSQTAYLGVRPNEGGEYPPIVPIVDYFGATTWSYEKNVPFIITHPILYRTSNNSGGKIEYVFALTDKNENIKEIISKEISMFSYDNNSGPSFIHRDTCMVTKDFEESDKIVMCYRYPGEDEKEWKVAFQEPYAGNTCLRMVCEGDIEDLVGFEVMGRRISIIKPNNVSVQIKRDDGLMGGNRYIERKDMYGDLMYYRGDMYWFVRDSRPWSTYAKFYINFNGDISGHRADVTFSDMKSSYTIKLTF